MRLLMPSYITAETAHRIIDSRKYLCRKPSSVFDGTFGYGRDMAF
ncbi:hypothetical protein SA20RB_135 [Escherichia phage vB_EcoM_SA20RB]|nr:hypothetical protein SA20RB_135 [Escherichia phage vB_EcoM_SA20RB]URY11935.1 hypothetical protein [Shigella phage ESh17]CAJ1092919.1 hypothetical protein QOTSP_178 [Escherichia phage vB_Eco_QOTSP]CAJ1578480.1 hypothetical protein SOLLY_149 [Escherichia phage vB_Eco_Solly]